MAEMKTLNGYEVVDAKAREDIKNLGDTTQQRLAEIETAIPNLEGYATETYVNEQIEAIPEPDLSPYALKSELPVVPTKVSAFENDTGYLTEHQDLSGKADVEHEHPEYLTEHQSLAEYAKKTDIPDTSSFITMPEVEAKGYLTEHQDISGKADVGHQHTISDITDYSEPDLSGYALKTELPTVPTEISAFNNDVGYLTEHQSLEGYATETYVDEAIANIDIPEAKREVYYFDPSQLEFDQDGWAIAPEELVEFAARVASGDLLSLYYKFETRWLPAEFNYVSSSSNNKIYIMRSASQLDLHHETESVGYQYWVSSGDGVAYVKEHFITPAIIASKAYVDEAIAALEARIAALEALHATE